MGNNFTMSDSWNHSIILRYDIDKINKIDDIYFYEDNYLLKCQHFFDFNIYPSSLAFLKKKISNNYKIKFSYINNGKLKTTLNKWANNNNFKFNIIDTWEAPRLIITTSIQDYLKYSVHSQIRRNYNSYLKNKTKYNIYNSDTDDILKLWNYVLKIDFNSWKKKEKSDMKNLDREDLQYLPFMLSEKENSNLIVFCDINDNPLAYSLMFKNSDGFWYAVKWGASYEGRKLYVGFYCLFYHLEYLFSINNSLSLDFWGRRNDTYDKLKNSSIIRNHILISKE